MFSNKYFILTKLDSKKIHSIISQLILHHITDLSITCIIYTKLQQHINVMSIIDNVKQKYFIVNKITKT